MKDLHTGTPNSSGACSAQILSVSLGSGSSLILIRCADWAAFVDRRSGRPELSCCASSLRPLVALSSPMASISAASQRPAGQCRAPRLQRFPRETPAPPTHRLGTAPSGQPRCAQSAPACLAGVGYSARACFVGRAAAARVPALPEFHRHFRGLCAGAGRRRFASGVKALPNCSPHPGASAGLSPSSPGGELRKYGGRNTGTNAGLPNHRVKLQAPDEQHGLDGKRVRPPSA